MFLFVFYSCHLLFGCYVVFKVNLFNIYFLIIFSSSTIDVTSTSHKNRFNAIRLI